MLSLYRTTITIKNKTMQIQDYQNLKNKLEKISSNHTKKYDRNASGYLDATFIQIKMYGKDWRLKKQVGCKKDYNGWFFFTTSTNSNGYVLYEKIDKACKDFEFLLVLERQI